MSEHDYRRFERLAESFIKLSRKIQACADDQILAGFLYMAEAEMHQVLARRSAAMTGVDSGAAASGEASRSV